jgi:Family of unknown function (DUF6328)
MPGNHQERGSEPTRDEVVPMLGEARMVVPGIQSLFGFQLIAVFTEGFRSLDAVQRLLHFTSLLATLIAIGLIMSPAAHHRLAEEWAATARFMRISSRLIALAMIALMIALTIEIVVISDFLFGSVLVDSAFAAAIVVFFGGLWFFWPLATRRPDRKYD